MRYSQQVHAREFSIGKFEYRVCGCYDEDGFFRLKHHCYNNGEEISLLPHFYNYSPHKKLNQQEFAIELLNAEKYGIL